MKFVECFERSNKSKGAFINADTITNIYIAPIETEFDVRIATTTGTIYTHNVLPLSTIIHADKALNKLIDNLGDLVES